MTSEKGLLGLRLTRFERLKIGDDVEIFLAPSNKGKDAKLVIKAPKDLKVLRAPVNLTPDGRVKMENEDGDDDR